DWSRLADPLRYSLWSVNQPAGLNESFGPKIAHWFHLGVDLRPTAIPLVDSPALAAPCFAGPARCRARPSDPPLPFSSEGQHLGERDDDTPSRIHVGLERIANSWLAVN